MSNEKKSYASKGTNEIIRVKRIPNNFVTMDKGFFEDSRLSYKAKGILGYLLTKPDNWEVRITDLKNHAKDGRDSIYAGLKELQDHGYYRKVQVRNDKGRLSHWECFICEVPMTNREESPNTAEPLTEKPKTVKPLADKPNTEYPDTAKPYTDYLNTENPSPSNNNITNIDLSKNYPSNNDGSNNNHTHTSSSLHEDNHGKTSGEREGDKSKANTAKIQYAEFVSMTNDEYSSLVAKLGEDGVAWCINKLDNYKGSTGTKYENDYRTILSWVTTRYQEHLQTQAKANRHNFSGQGYYSAQGADGSVVHVVEHSHSNQARGGKTGDAFEDYVYQKIEEAKRNGTI